MKNNRIQVQTTVAAPASKAWQTFTRPEHITGWNFASDDWQCPGAENDLRPGGRYSARMEAKDGSFGFDFTAVYDEVEEGRRLSYTMEDGRRATTTFEPAGEGTTVTTTFDPEGTNDPEMQRAGWQAILDNYRRYTEAQ